MIDRSKLQMRGTYGIAASGAVSDAVLLKVAQDFEAQVMRKIEALSPSDLATRYNGDDQVLVTTKYDGESTYIYYEQDGPVFCFSANSGRVRLGFKALDELTQRLRARVTKKCLLRAELVLRDAADANRRAGVSEVIRVSFSGNETELDALQLVLLDAVMLDGRNLIANQQSFVETLELLVNIAGQDAGAPVFAMASQRLPERDVPAAFVRVIEQGGEGIVVRRLNRFEARKIKPHRTVDAVILGFVEGEFEGQYGVASLLTGLCYPQESAPDAFLQTFVRVGSGLTDAERVKMLDRLRPLKIAAPLPMTDSSGRTVQFVRPQLVAELHGEDLVTGDTRREARTQMLGWIAAEERYQFLGLSACPRLTFARFAKLREDKLWQADGARFAQVSAAPRPSPVLGDRSARIIRREVYLKGEMLRKLVVVEKADPDLPFPYLVYWTDFSAKRAEPLKVSVDMARDVERAFELAELRLKEELSKGYVRVDNASG